MRLFVAVDPPAEAVEALRASLPTSLLAEDGLRWSAPEQWHVTLAFLGEVDPSVVPELDERLARAAGRTASLRLRLLGAGRFGRQVLWVGLAGDVVPLSRLADRCTAAARRCGIATEEQRFRPHLTVARGRGRGSDLRAAVGALSSYAGPWWGVSELRLVRSHLGPPLMHETIATFALSGSTGAEAPPEPDR